MSYKSKVISIPTEPPPIAEEEIDKQLSYIKGKIISVSKTDDSTLVVIWEPDHRELLE